MRTPKVTVSVAMETTAITEQLRVLRLLCSHIGYALDTAILALEEPLAEQGDQ